MGFWRWVRWIIRLAPKPDPARATAAARARLAGQCRVAAQDCVDWGGQGDERQ